MAAIIRSTPSYHVPPTQNTAPVLEFRCLYTHDLLKKQKKWHDGSVKFHTFNRRVMVYDDVKNYIGDLHYRLDEEFGEGLELQLDRPVKVEVGEPIGQTQTDLAPLLDRGRGERENRQTSGIHAPGNVIRRANAFDNNGRPKSLQDVLGLSQGRIGRARLPLQSPFEQRQELNDFSHGQPPAKKQRVLHGQGTKHPRPTSPQKMRNSVHELGVAELQYSPIVARSDHPAEASHVAENSSNGNTRMRNDQRTRTKNRVAGQTPASSPPTSKSKPIPAPPAKLGSKIKRRNQTISDTRKIEKHNSEKENVPPPPIVKGTTNGSTRSVEKPSSLPAAQRVMTKLKMRAPPPRKKLMYKALIPGNTSTPKNPKISEHTDTGMSNETAASRKSQLQISHFIDDAMELESRASLQPSRTHEPNDQQSKKHSPRSNETPVIVTVSSSPLFMSQDPSEILNISQSIAENYDMDFILTQSTDNTEHLINKTPEDKARSEEAPLLASTGPSSSPLFTETRVDDTSTTIPSQTSAVNQGVIPPSRGANTMQAEQASIADIPPCVARPFRRVVSDSGPPGLALTAGAEATEICRDVHRSPARGQHSVSLIDSATRTPPRVSVQRAQSDSAALAQMKMASPITARPSQLVQPKGDDQGAWTKVEAFLLFDKWPAAKASDKPSFDRLQSRQNNDTYRNEDTDDYDGIDEHIELSMDINARSGHGLLRQERGTGVRPSFPGIRSARAVLRDEF